MIKRLVISMAALALAASPALAKPVAAPAARAVAPKDAAAIAAALDRVYAVISGPPGQMRDWARMRTLFTPDARLTAITAKGLMGGTVDEYITKSGPYLIKVGFIERELARRVEVYGDLAHAWSSYEGSGDGGKLKVRGINSFQLVRQNGKWLVQSIFWQAESPALPLPADMKGR